MAEVSERALIAKVERRLTSKYADIPGDQVAVAVQSAAARFEQSPIRDFVPLLVERRATIELATRQKPLHRIPLAIPGREIALPFQTGLKVLRVRLVGRGVHQC